MILSLDYLTPHSSPRISHPECLRLLSLPTVPTVPARRCASASRPSRWRALRLVRPDPRCRQRGTSLGTQPRRTLMRSLATRPERRPRAPRSESARVRRPASPTRSAAARRRPRAPRSRSARALRTSGTGLS